MATPAAILGILVEANTASAQASLTKMNSALGATTTHGTAATKTTSKLGTATKTTGAKLATAARYAAGAAAAYLSIAQAKAAVTTTQDLASASANLSRNLGLNTKEASRWASVAKTRDIDNKALTASFATLARSFSAVEGNSKDARSALKTLGLTQKDVAQGGDVLAKAARDSARGSKVQRHALMDLGITQEDFGRKNGALAHQLQLSLESTTEDTSKQRAAFESLGISQRDLAETGGNFNKVIKLVADGFGNAEGGADRFAAAQTLLGKGYQNLLPLMADGSKALQKQLELGDKYGATMGGKAVKAQQHLAATLRESERAWQGLQVQFGTAVTPALEAVNKQFQKMAEIMASGKLTDDEKFQQIADILREDFQKALDVALALIPGFASEVGKAAPKIAGALVQGFLGADIWGKLALGAWFFTKVGLTSTIFKAAGTRLAAAFGLSFVAGTTEAAGGAALTSSLLAGGTPSMVAAGETAGGTFLTGFASALPVAGLIGVGFWANAHDSGETAGKRFADGIADKLGDTATRDKVQESLDNLAAKTHVTTPFAPGARVTPAQMEAKETIHVFRALKDEYGSVLTAAVVMSEGQKKAYILAAREAVEKGNMTHKQFDSLIDIFNKTGSSFKDTQRSMKETWDAIAKQTGESTNKVMKSTGSMAKNWIGDLRNVKGMSDVVLAAIADDTNKELRAFGVEQVHFRSSGTVSSGAVGAHHVGKHAQRGGMIGGSGTGDRVHVMAEPGEGFINKTAVKALGGKGAIDAINSAVPRFQTGGFVGMQPGIVSLVKNVIGRFGGAMSSGYRPGDPGFHGRGMAADWVGGDWTGASRYINSIGPSLLEGIHQAPPGTQVSWDSGHQVPPSFWGPSTWAAHTSHIHMAISGAVKAMGGMIGQIKRQVISGPDGPWKNILQGSADKARAGANRYLAKQMPSASFDTGATSGGLGVPALESLWVGANGPKGIAELMAHIALAESGGVPTATNPSGATGLWQILGSLVPGNLLNPKINALNAVAKYQTQGLSAWDASRGTWGPWASAHGFKNGGMVPGPIGAPRAIIAHGGEHVTPAGTPHVEVNLYGDASALLEDVEVLIDGKVPDIAEYTLREGGRNRARSRQLAGQAGRA